MAEPPKESKTEEEKDSSVIFTIRMKKSLKERIEKVAFNLGEKPAKTAQNYLALSYIMTVRSDYSKSSINNYPLTIFPAHLMEGMFQRIEGDINAGNRFIIQSDLGDRFAQFVIDALSLRGIPTTDYVGVFDYLKELGWINYTKMDDKIAIQKSSFPRSFVYAFVYRLLQKIRFPEAEWNDQLFNVSYPFPLNTDKKEEKAKNKEFGDRYARVIGNTLDPDRDKETNTNYYVFRKLVWNRKEDKK